MTNLSHECYEIFAINAIGDTVLLPSKNQKKAVLQFTTFSEARSYYDAFKKKCPELSIKMMKRSSI